MSKRKRTALERVREARLMAIERVTAGLASQPSLDSDALHAFRELCAAAEHAERQSEEQADMKLLVDRLETLIGEYNKLIALVEEHEQRLRALAQKTAGAAGVRRLG